ncbi:MAG: BCCT family transporter [Gemmatimonadetes bacterium]|nr:BCCT family transporter [Gemmatimonadota bacterium]MYB69814.1 BCCT family transporter [Gemmatimonadota bacterium]
MGISEAGQVQPLDDEGHQKLLGLDIYLTPVFTISSVTIVAFVTGALVFQEAATEVFENTRQWLTVNLDWFFLITANFLLLFCLYVACSPLGKVRLGGADAKPEYSNATWFAMLFAAGVGIGLLFYGAAEPIYYFQSPPLGLPAGTEEAAGVGIAATVFHWGLHAWSIYGVVGLALAYFAYNRGLPLTIRSVFYPLFGDRIWGWPGHIIDTFAIFAGLFGLATSLGLGVKQLASGLHYLFDVPANNTTMVVLIMAITSIALISVLTGINVGIKRLSQFNITLALLLLLMVIVLGPTLYIFRSMFAALGSYCAKVVPLSNWVGREDADFLHGWTTFYWAWWFAWAPFVGTFIARISKGRTVREFTLFVLIPPMVLCWLWFGTFGGTALHQHIVGGYTGVTENVAAWKLEIALFKMFDELPVPALLSSVALLLTTVFFVTSSDSGSLIIDTIAAGGKVDAPVAQRVFWCTIEGLVAIALLLGGGLHSLQAASLATGFPFALVVLGMAVCVWLGLRREVRAVH